MVVQPSAAEIRQMRTGKISSFPCGKGMLALAVALLAGCTVEQVLIGQVYILDTPAAGACPQLEWRFVVNPQRAIDGSLSSKYGQQRIGGLSGVLNPDDSFRMTATAEGGRTAVVSGQFTSLISTISIHGDTRSE